MKMSDVLMPPYSVEEHSSGWFTVCDKEGNTIDASGDGGFNRDDAYVIATAVNCHDELVEALSVALAYIRETPCDPGIYPAQLKEWQLLESLNCEGLLAKARGDK